MKKKDYIVIGEALGTYLKENKILASKSIDEKLRQGRLINIVSYALSLQDEKFNPRKFAKRVWEVVEL